MPVHISRRIFFNHVANLDQQSQLAKQLFEDQYTRTFKSFLAVEFQFLTTRSNLVTRCQGCFSDLCPSCPFIRKICKIEYPSREPFKNLRRSQNHRSLAREFSTRQFQRQPDRGEIFPKKGILILPELTTHESL